jgi:hypothetical protein
MSFFWPLCCLSFLTQWSKEEGQATQWEKEGQATQRSKEKGQATQWQKEQQQTQ